MLPARGAPSPLDGLARGAPTAQPRHRTAKPLHRSAPSLPPDLSFNNIEVIKGLDSLVNLEDLSLFNNRISRIDSLDALGKLQVLSLGNNQIDNIMNVSGRHAHTRAHARGSDRAGSAAWAGAPGASQVFSPLPLTHLRVA